ncbi:hypothetical protein FOA52_015143 [Chlamydomonas sp. UWO 241]|nr:hypothetical protein FOA52_015143 [Chlamydomonas sp. UWO 241]
MWFYLLMGSMFSLYAADLLFLVIVATIARSRDAIIALQRQRELKSDAEVFCGCLPGTKRAPSSSKTAPSSSAASRHTKTSSISSLSGSDTMSPSSGSDIGIGSTATATAKATPPASPAAAAAAAAAPRPIPPTAAANPAAKTTPPQQAPSQASKQAQAPRPAAPRTAPPTPAPAPKQPWTWWWSRSAAALPQAPGVQQVVVVRQQQQQQQQQQQAARPPLPPLAGRPPPGASAPPAAAASAGRAAPRAPLGAVAAGGARPVNTADAAASAASRVTPTVGAPGGGAGQRGAAAAPKLPATLPSAAKPPLIPAAAGSTPTPGGAALKTVPALRTAIACAEGKEEGGGGSAVVVVAEHIPSMPSTPTSAVPCGTWQRQVGVGSVGHREDSPVLLLPPAPVCELGASSSDSAGSSGSGEPVSTVCDIGSGSSSARSGTAYTHASGAMCALPLPQQLKLTSACVGSGCGVEQKERLHSCVACEHRAAAAPLPVGRTLFSGGAMPANIGSANHGNGAAANSSLDSHAQRVQQPSEVQQQAQQVVQAVQQVQQAQQALPFADGTAAAAAAAATIKSLHRKIPSGVGMSVLELQSEGSSGTMLSSNPSMLASHPSRGSFCEPVGTITVLPEGKVVGVVKTGPAGVGGGGGVGGCVKPKVIACADHDGLAMLPSKAPAVRGLPLDPNEWPKVLVQLPMFNEESHCDLVVAHCAKMRWPRSRLLIQVLDDSTKQHVRDKVDAACAVLAEQGHPVQVMRRTNRHGYKAGAMIDGLVDVQADGYQFVAVFDADFEPPENFLEETVPHLHNDNKLGFVQTRWYSPSHSFLTWAQRINLDFHFDVEQRARSFLGWFFNFNGTAGVWRIAAMEDAGGWECDTVVEDMDLSLRVYLSGWGAIYLPHVESPNELPTTLSTYKTQQFRWLAGPMQILVKCYSLIWNAKRIPFTKRLNCYWFFSRYILFAAITFGVLSVPPVILWVDPWVWHWPQIYFMVSINFALCVYLYVTPWSIPYLLFSITIGYFKGHAMLSGLVGAERSKKWKVTKKGAGGGGGWRDLHRPYMLEMSLCIYYAGMAAASFVYLNWMLGGYCVIMATLFLILSFGDYVFKG